MTTITAWRHDDRCRTLLTLRGTVLLACCLFFAAVACAEDATERLLNLVGQDVGLCVEIPRLEEHLAIIKQSEFSKRLEASALHKTWLASAESQKLRKSRESIEKHTGKSIDQLACDVFGNSVVIAVYSSAATGTAGVLLTEADSIELLDAALASWNQAEPQETIEHAHAGGAYYTRTRVSGENNPAKPLYYVKLDRTFALSDNEEMIRKVLDLEALRKRAAAATVGSDASPQGSILQSAEFQQARRSLSLNPFAAAYLNPRAWDSLFPASDADSRQNQVLGRIWRRLQSLAMAVDLEHGFVVETVAHYDGKDTPPAWTKSLDRMQGPPEFLRHIPVNAVAVFAGRHDVSGLVNLVVKQASAEMEQRQWESFRQVSRGLLLGLDLFDDVLPSLKPNWGGYVIPRESSDTATAAAIPLDGLVAFEFASGSAADGKATLHDALDNGLNTGMNLVAAYFNTRDSKTPAVVRTTQRPDSITRWIEGIRDYRPGYVLTSNHLAFTSSPDLAAKFLATPSEKPARHVGLERCQRAYFPQDNQISFVDVATLRRLMETYRARLVEKAAEANALSTKDCEERLARLMDVATLVDNAFIAGQIDGRRLRLVIGGVVDDNADVTTSSKP